jgi:hypothetical protein
MKNKCCVFFSYFLLLSSSLWAQTEDFGVWTSVGAEKKLGKWNFGTNAELRTKNNSGQVDRLSFQLETAYNILKPLKAGVSYEFIYYNDSEYSDYQPRQRYSLFLQGDKKFGDFSISLRERTQRTVKDERDRITESGGYDSYKVNPEWYWRNRIKVEYNIPHFPVNPSLSFETFYQLNNPDGNTFDNLRYTVSFSYKLAKHHKVEVYGLVNKKINVTAPVTTYVGGFGYIFSF